MLKEIIGVTVTGVLAVYMFWYIIPGLKTVYNIVLINVNQTEPTMKNVLVVSNGWFTMLPIFVAIVAGGVIFFYVTNRSANDIS